MTTKKRLIDARLGQGKFREQLLVIWNRQCAVTGCRTEEVLRASHIKPWSKSNNQERLDPNNGLLLVANLDALFDRGLISFKDDGGIIISKRLSQEDVSLLALNGVRIAVALNGKVKEYLQFHRKEYIS